MKQIIKFFLLNVIVITIAGFSLVYMSSTGLISEKAFNLLFSSLSFYALANHYITKAALILKGAQFVKNKFSKMDCQPKEIDNRSLGLL